MRVSLEREEHRTGNEEGRMQLRRLIRIPLLAALALAFSLTGATPIAPRVEAQTFDVEEVATGLATIWAVDFAPDGRIFLTERGGRVRTVRDGALDPQPWITLDVVEMAESGLLGLALDPGFATNGYVY